MDARAAHPGVFGAAGTALQRLPRDRTLRIVELGGGAGGAFGRWMELAAPFPHVEFTATDRNPKLLAAYRAEAVAWAHRAGYGCSGLRFAAGGRTVALRLLRAEAPGDFAGWPPGGFDAVVAQSLWDLVPPGTAAPLARRLLRPGGVFHAALTFAGSTRFDPPLGELDRFVLDRYHQSMANPSAGTRLTEEFRAAGSGFVGLAVGASDWRVAPTDRGYPGDEAFFLETLLGFVEKELRGAGASARWLEVRRRQLREGRLRFAAAQRDLTARRAPAGDQAVEFAT